MAEIIIRFRALMHIEEVSRGWHAESEEGSRVTPESGRHSSSAPAPCPSRFV
jgi:hypothetical protein